MDRNTTISRRNLLLGVGAAAGTAALTGNAPLTALASRARKGTITVNYWDNFVTQAPWIDREIKIFEKANPGIKINKTTHASTDYPNLFALAVKSGNQPDVFVIPFTPTLPEQVKQHFIGPIPKSAEHHFRSRFPKGTFHAGSNVFGGRTYSAPLTGNAPILLLYVNNRVFRKAGLVDSKGHVKVPHTWDDMTRAAQTIVKKSNGSTYGFGFGGNSKYFLGFFVDLLVRGAGLPQGLLEIGNIDYRVGRSTFHKNEAMVHTLQLLRGWKDKGLVYPNALSISDETARAFMTQDKFGMLGDGIWCEGGWKTDGFSDYSVTTLPSPTAHPKAYYYYKPGGFQFGLSPSSSHQEAAFLWMDHLYSVDAGKRFVQMGNDLSVFPQNNKPHNIPSKPFADYSKLAKYDLPEPDPTIRNPAQSSVVIAPATPDIFDISVGAYTGQIDGRSAIVDALAKLDATNNANLAKGIADAQAKGFKVSAADYVFPDWKLNRPYYTHLHKG